MSRTGYSGELGYEVYCRPEHAETIWQAMLDQGAAFGIRPYGLAAVESLRIEAGLIFIGYDYFPGLTSPFHMNLDRTIKLDAGDFVGRDALRAELDAGITHRMVSLVIAGEEAPDYSSPVTRLGREVGRLLSPSAGRSPTIERVIGMACIEAELTEVGTPLEVTLPDGRSVPALVDTLPDVRPGEEAPAGVTATADDPVGVLATGTGGYGAVQALRRALPHEDVVLVCDHAYAPYPRRPPRVVLDRSARLADELAARPVKVLLVASAAATDEALAFLQARLAPLPVIGMDATLAAAGRLAPGGVCSRSRARAACAACRSGRRRGACAGRRASRSPSGRACASSSSRAAPTATRRGSLVSSRLAALGPEVTALALVCPHSAAVRGTSSRRSRPAR